MTALRAALLVVLGVGGLVTFIGVGDSFSVHDQRLLFWGFIAGLVVAFVLVPLWRWADRNRD